MSSFLFFLKIKNKCLEMNRVWKNHPFNFDNIHNAILTLFVISTYDNWGVILNIAINSNKNLSVINII